MMHIQKKYKTLFIKSIYLLCGVVLAVCCSSTSDDGNPRPTDDDNPIGEIDSTMTVDSTQAGAPTIFTVIGDVPYNDAQRDGLISLIDAHNDRAASEFVVHVGDIKPGADPCDESIYEDVSGLLENFEAPTFIVLGDNEYNDCDNPADALSLWNEYFLHFNEKWEFPHTVEYQEERPENFAWVQNDILFLGLNLVGSSVHDQAEWDERLADDAVWVEKQLEVQDENSMVAVVFAHANITEIGPEKFQRFTDRFRASAKTFDKPVLYVQGDGHIWFQNRPWPEENILRLQIEGGANAVEVTVNPVLDQPFVFDRRFLD